ncbi:MAG: hypothetical protein ACOH5I_09135 [Oligoflexus sp.]
MIKVQLTVILLSLLFVSCNSEDLDLRFNKKQKSESEDALNYAQASAKATAAVGNIAIIDSTEQEFTTVLKNSIKTPNAALFISGSIECGLFTRTTVRSKGGKKSTSIASASVKARVLVNGQVAEPGEIIFCDRTQELSAIFQGLLTDEQGNSCLITDLETGAVIIDEECLQPEEVDLILSTMNANAFNFVAQVGTGVQTVEFQAKISTSQQVTGDGDAAALATIGKGAVLIEQVRLRKNDPIFQ